MDTLALWRMSLTRVSYFKFEEVVTPSSLNEDTEISRGMGLRKQGDDLRKQIGIIMDLEGFTVMSTSKVSSLISLRILVGSLIKFL